MKEFLIALFVASLFGAGLYDVRLRGELSRSKHDLAEVLVQRDGLLEDRDQWKRKSEEQIRLVQQQIERVDELSKRIDRNCKP